VGDFVTYIAVDIVRSCSVCYKIAISLSFEFWVWGEIFKGIRLTAKSKRSKGGEITISSVWYCCFASTHG
jgi:hypothetical protein